MMKNLLKLLAFVFLATCIDLAWTIVNRYNVRPEHVQEAENLRSKIFSLDYQPDFENVQASAIAACHKIGYYQHSILGALGWAPLSIEYYRSLCFSDLAEKLYDPAFCRYVYSTIWYGIPVGGKKRAYCTNDVGNKAEQRNSDHKIFKAEQALMGPESMTIKRISDDTWTIKLNLRGTQAGMYRVRASLSRPLGKDEVTFYDEKITLDGKVRQFEFNVTEDVLFKAHKGMDWEGREGNFPLHIYLTYLGETNAKSKDSKNIYGNIRTYDKRLNVEETIKGFYD